MKKPNKPLKPYPEFPLFPHSNGQWAKKVKGKLHYFGKWDDPDAAIKRFKEQVDDLHAGRKPYRPDTTTPVIILADVVNVFLNAKADQRDAGEITARHWQDYYETSAHIIKFFGRATPVRHLKPSDFTQLRASFAERWGPTKLGNEIQRIRTIFRWAYETDLLKTPMKFGPDFKRPAKAVSRRAQLDRQAIHGTLDFNAAELTSLLAEASGWLKACILLGINAGFGAADCGRLRKQNVDFVNGWYDLPRRKTAVPRRFYMWPETREAIAAAIKVRPTPTNPDNKDLCFLTEQRRPVWWESAKGAKTDSVGKAFTKLCVKLDIKKPGRSYYSLRRTYETVAGNSMDQIAVNFAMGHSDSSMAAIYRQGIDDSRLVNVAMHVHKWLFS